MIKYINWLNAGMLCLCLTACAGGKQVSSSNTATQEATVIELTQVGCQFLEVEALKLSISTN